MLTMNQDSTFGKNHNAQLIGSTALINKHAYSKPVIGDHGLKSSQQNLMSSYEDKTSLKFEESPN